MVTFESLSQGSYGIWLSAAATVAVVQDNSVTALLRVEAAHDCGKAGAAGEFVSVGGPVTLQFADVFPSRISVVVWRR